MRPSALIHPWLPFFSLVLLLMASPAASRELHVDADELVAIELVTVGVNTLTGSPVVVLRDPESGDTVPVVIGPPEAHAILMALNEIAVPRPMTHDLISNILAAAGMRLERVLIDALIDGTYHGALELRTADGDGPIYVDARPSDSLAIAVRENASIFIAPAVLEAARQQDLALSEDVMATALGITVLEVTKGLRETMGLGDRTGVLVSRSEGAAAQAGIPPGALILRVNGQTPGSPKDFLALIDDAPEGDGVQIVYWMEGEEHEVNLTNEPPAPELIQEQLPRLRV